MLGVCCSLASLPSKEEGAKVKKGGEGGRVGGGEGERRKKNAL